MSVHPRPNPGMCEFDLKVNVDFNTGKINLNVPHSNQPFARKQAVPVVYGSQPVLPYQPSNYSSMGASQHPSLGSPGHLPGSPHMHNMGRNDLILSSSQSPYPSEYSDIYRHKPRSANDTYPDTFSSFSYNLERSVDAVNCVICDKPINRDHFQAHLEQHKGRKKEYNRPDSRLEPQQSSKQPSFSVQNEHSMGGLP